MLFHISNRELVDYSRAPNHQKTVEPSDAHSTHSHTEQRLEAPTSHAEATAASQWWSRAGPVGTALSALIAQQEPLVFWTATLVLVSFCWVLSAHFYGFQMMRVGLHVRVGCSYLIYRKSLKLGQLGTSSSQTTMGKMVSTLYALELFWMLLNAWQAFKWMQRLFVSPSRAHSHLSPSQKIFLRPSPLTNCGPAAETVCNTADCSPAENCGSSLIFLSQFSPF